MHARDRGLRALLRLLPRAVREAHGAEMLDLARADHARAAAAGATALARFWVAWAVDVLRAAWRARRPHVPPSPGRSPATALELRLALRSLRATSGTSAIVITTLALGIGVTTAVASGAYEVLVRPFDYRDPDSLMVLTAPLAVGQVPDARFSGLAFTHIRERTTAFADVAAISLIRQNLTGAGYAEQVQVGWVSDNFLALLGATPLAGRLLAPGDVPGTAMISEDLWARAFARRPDAIGRTVGLDGRSYTVVGVLPATFRLHLPRLQIAIDVWKVPDNWWQNGDIWTAPASGQLRLIARLAPGRSVDAASREAETLAEEIRARVPEYEKAGLSIRAAPLFEAVVGPVRAPLLLLVASASAVLLIACANVMTLLLVRAQGRHRELAVRLALGSSRTRLVRGLFVETMVLAAAGGTLGLALAWLARPAIAAMASGVPRAGDGTSLTTALLISAGAALTCTLAGGLAAAFWTVRVPSGADLTLRSTPTAARQRLSHTLIVLQVATSLVLLVGAGLLGASLVATARVDPGFDADRLVTFAVSLPGTKYTWPDGTNRFLRRFEDELRRQPGVEAVGVIWPLPLSGSQWLNEYTGGAVRAGDRARARHHLVTPGYFDAVRTPLVAGRTFSHADDPKSVVVVSETLARRAWPGESALGKFLATNPWGGTRRMQVIGVAADVRFRGLRQPPEEVIYVDAAGWSWSDWEVDVVLRTAVEPLSIVPAARATLAGLDADVPLARPREMTAYVSDQLAPGRNALGLVAVFALLAATLAAIGLYGAIARAIADRNREIGIRVALGSAPGAVVRLLVSQGLRLTAIGLAIGLAASFWLTRLVGGYLFGVEPTDVATYAGVVAGFAIVALAACAIPARRALRVNPVDVLR